MTLVSELEGLPSFDYTDPGIAGPAFHAAMADLRSQGWLAQGPYGYIVLDHEAGEHFLRSRATTFPGLTLAEIFQVQEGPLLEEMRRNILHLNGPDHSRLRALLNPSLSPRAVQRHRPALRALLERLFDQIAGESQPGETIAFEAVSSLSKPYPAQAIATVMGAPLSDAERLNHWSHWIQGQFDVHSMMEERDKIEAAVAEFYEYAEALLAKRRRDPGDDLISTLLSAEEQGDRLSEVECVNLVLNVLIGGVDTTQSQLAHTLRLLAERPSQWEMLRERPELAGAAVEEALRFEPVTPFTARIVVEEELTFRDVTFPRGTIVMVCAFTGNRSGEGEVTHAGGEGTQGGSAEDFDIAAERPRSRVLTFGAGVHNCVGANLARAELQEALSFLAPRIAELRLDGEAVYGTITGIYGLAKLPLRCRLAAA